MDIKQVLSQINYYTTEPEIRYGPILTEHKLVLLDNYLKASGSDRLEPCFVDRAS